MIRELRIKNFAIIEELEMEFHPGLTVLTGETGAGKSIIVGALSLLLGKRAGEDVIKSGAERAEVEAIFEIDGEEVILRREVLSGGRSRAFYQGRGVPINFLKELGPSLFEIHSQLEYGWVLKESNQLDALDRYGGSTIKALLDEYERLYREYLESSRKLEELRKDEEELRRRREEISFYLEEIEKASLEVGEEEELLSKREKLLNLEELKSHLKEALHLLEGEGWSGGILDKCGEFLTVLEKIGRYEADISQISKDIQSFLLILKDISSALYRKLESLTFEEGNLDLVEERLSLIRRLKRKHGVNTVSELLELASRWKEELQKIGNLDNEVYSLKERVNELYKLLCSLGERISEERKRCASLLESEVKRILEKLAMGNIVFKIGIEKGELGIKGFDKVSFLMSPSPQDELRKINLIASGGEISRLSFALKCAIAQNYAVPTLIFDEIDVGIGGDVANMLGYEIKKLSEKRQVICITHLASIASRADHHYFVDKVVEGGKVKSRVKLLKGEERIRELARMLSGKVSEIALEHARELLKGG
ncbi:MAG: DNA repair protein RecN [Synergistetes bacterium]|nr:MAG: DNA repair protein RecN [bacterium 42_11]MBC7330923.1 DNA repair protein RecN [Synergistota bacterium]MDK2870884.1 repair protein RecN [bacterium]